MSNDELRKTLIAIGRSPDTFQRDTPQLLKLLENLETINRRFKNIGHNPERRSADIFAPGYSFENQAD